MNIVCSRTCSLVFSFFRNFFKFPYCSLFRYAVDTVDALVITLPRGDPSSTVRNIDARRLLYARAKPLGIVERVRIDISITHVVVTLP